MFKEKTRCKRGSPIPRRQHLMGQIQDINDKKESLESSLNKQITKLKRDLQDQKSKVNKQQQSSQNKSSTDQLQKKLKEKENQIKELLEEGSKLSMKEVTLTQTIKKMKQKELDLEDELNNIEKENENLSSKVHDLEAELEDVRESERSVKEERLEHQTLQAKFERVCKERDNLSNELKEMKFKRLDVQLGNTKKQLEDELKVNAELQSNLDKLTNQFSIFKEEAKNEQSQLEYKLQREKTKYADLVDENSVEIKRLEEKIETLRMQSESTMDKSSLDVSSSSLKNVSGISIDVLQAQYTQAQENWKLIESTYLRKIANLESDIEVLKQKDVNYSKKVKALTSDLKMKSVEANELLDNENTLRIELQTLHEEIDRLKTDNESLKKEQETLQRDFETERGVFEKKIQALKDEKNRLTQINKLRVDTGISNLGGNGSSSNNNSNSSIGLYMQEQNSSTSLNYFKPQKSSSALSFDGIGFGESSTTPRQGSYARMYSGNSLSSLTPQMSAFTPHEKIMAHHNSITPYLENSETFISEEIGEEDTTFEPPMIPGSPLVLPKRGATTPSGPSLHRHHSSITASFGGGNSFSYNRDETETRNSSTIGGRPESVAGTANIQIVSKLSTHIRRLELEVLNLKDEISDLAKQKQEASSEIVKLLKENEKVDSLKSDLEGVKTQYDTLNKNYEATLQLLGEKSERCGELEADVDDLKDLLRQQVTQMVEMQEKIQEQQKNMR
ncbi:unnamed protein product [Ambrosiozyma monospora]|uniref:Unnamed protein product n=1 Tax=Ambrosiozyma monospora TaxID=43982 RepID=A0ACB5T580_AMBMO|nr:unnamed protein product [Ambrosiozyma monospora]